MFINKIIFFGVFLYLNNICDAMKVRLTTFCQSGMGGGLAGGTNSWSGQNVVLSSEDSEDVYCSSGDIVGGENAFKIPCSSPEESYYMFTFNSCDKMKHGKEVEVYSKGKDGTTVEIEYCKVKYDGKWYDGEGGNTNRDIIPLGSSVSGDCTVVFDAPDNMFG